ncbi:MAG: response regulator [Pseudomonadota bacterium]|nr:response regulator [Pseudomonadota bacterium]
MRLLLIEDDLSLAAGLGEALKRRGYAVNHVARGEPALLALEADSADIVILDLGLPDIDGLTLLRRIRGGRHRQPVLILTARNAVSQKVAGLDLGADDYLAKPFDFDELDARLRALGRRLGTANTSRIEIGPIALDTATREVTRNGEPIELTRREYALLRALMENQSKVLARETLEDKLYAWGEEVASNALEVHIHHLRKKLGGDVIRTVRGVGYGIMQP